MRQPGTPAQSSPPAPARQQPSHQQAPSQQPAQQQAPSQQPPSRQAPRDEPAPPSPAGAANGAEPPTRPAAAVPSAGTAAGSGTVDAAAIRRVWDEILRAVGREKRTPHAILLTAEVADVRGNELVLAFTGAMVRAFERSQDVDWVLRKVLNEVVGGNWRVTAEVAKPGGTPPSGGGSPSGRPSGSSETPPPPADVPSADDEDLPEAGSGGAHDPVALLQAGLGARVIDERDAG